MSLSTGAWRFALTGFLASLPITAVLYSPPNPIWTTGAGLVLVGPFLAGAVAATYSSDPGAAGIRAGFIGGLLTPLELFVPVFLGLTHPKSLFTIVFTLALAVGIGLLLGLVFGYVGGWVTATALSPGEPVRAHRGD
ncbi:DUF5518 domain-containing protein [Natronobiforma cellulositropha]|uniref:DUF5518 domain-containing protein n=1 Tax=Natronobiforma cellulositropha TaxID=1679076 RepID=UPI0021D5887C|nr:DUF5518 domain-containing protein [Natronobiforma cellulositropha]